MSKNSDYPNIFIHGKLEITSREIRQEVIRIRRKYGWQLRVMPKKLGRVISETCDKIFLDVMCK